MRKQKKHPCLDLVLEGKNQNYEQLAREAVYRETTKQFPRKCSCGKVYRTEEQYTRETQSCGPAMNYKEINTLLFLRNCKCNSTIGLGLEHPQFDTLESYALFSSMKTLGEECFNKARRQISDPSFLETECGKCLAKYLSKEDLSRLIEDKQEKLEDQLQIGLNLFRERYNAWMEKRAKN